MFDDIFAMEVTAMETIGQRLRACREDRDLRQIDVAQKIGIHPIQIGRYEKDQSQPTAEVIRNLCWVYQVSADYILGLPKGLQWPR